MEVGVVDRRAVAKASSPRNDRSPQTRDVALVDEGAGRSGSGCGWIVVTVGIIRLQIWYSPTVPALWDTHLGPGRQLRGVAPG